MNRDEQQTLLITKGVETVLPSKDFLLSLLKKGSPLTVYCGFDPTAPTLHIGHTIQLRKLRQFQDLGHKILFLVGDFTARIGDPTDKTATRKQLTEKEVQHNLRLYKKQAGKFIRFSGRNKAEIRFNAKWLKKLTFADIISLASNVTVDQMLKRDMFVRRMQEEKPVYLHEFFYPLMQGYDSVYMNVDGEVGGNDQLFNMMMGRTLLKTLKDKEKFVITMKLLEDGTGKKMGKSEGNMVALTDTPEQMYGKIMSWPDGLIVPAFELCTDYSLEATTLIQEALAAGKNPRDSKMQLAFEITKLCSSEKEAHRAQEAFVSAFQKKEIPDSVLEVKATHAFDVILKNEGLISSTAELRRLVDAKALTHLESGGVVSFETVKTIPQKGTYKIGKNRFIRIV